MNNQKLEEVTQEKDLGILISNDLKVYQHIHKQWEFWELSTVLLCSDIRILCYVSTSQWSDLILNIVQQRGPLTTAKTKNWSKEFKEDSLAWFPTSRISHEQRLAKTKLWSLEDRRTKADLIEVYKIIHGLSTVRFITFFELSHNERTRGHSLKLHKKCVMTDLRQHFFSDRIVNKWNTLSEDIASASSLINFKGKLQRLHDGSSIGFFKSAWPSGPSQFPGEAQSGKLSGKLLPCQYSETFLL